MERKKAISMYLIGTMGQMIAVAIIFWILQKQGITFKEGSIGSTIIVYVGGLSSAMWGTIVSIKYKKISLKQVFIDFFNIKKSYKYYWLAFLFLFIVYWQGILQGKVNNVYLVIFGFISSILYGGIEELGWRYTFQPLLEEKLNFFLSTTITFLCWGPWHLLYFYINGSIDLIKVVPFLICLYMCCFMLASIYRITQSLWMCVMTHALFNMLATFIESYASIPSVIAIIILSMILVEKKFFVSKTVKI